MTTALVLLDESGDMGWTLDQPYRAGGSSRFFTIAAAVGAKNSHRKFGQLVRDLRRVQGWTTKNEKKWVDLGARARQDFACRVVDLSGKQRDIQLLVAVMEKRRVPLHIQGNFHLIYSWMASALMAPAIRMFRQASICPDDLNAGVGNINLLENVLRKDLWFHLRASTEIHRVPRTGALEDALAFCDYLAGAVQSHFEDGDSTPFLILERSIFLHRPWH